jgi:hypothetical protein
MEIMFAISEIRIPKALMKSPVISNAFIFSNADEKYINIKTLIK